MHEGASQGHTVGLGSVQGLESAALPQVAEEEGRAAREPTRRTASMGLQKYKGYKIRLQEYEGNADKKMSFYSIYKAIMWTYPRKNCHKGNDEFVPMIGGALI
jgi:hypothetical protein